VRREIYRVEEFVEIDDRERYDRPISDASLETPSDLRFLAFEQRWSSSLLSVLRRILRPRGEVRWLDSAMRWDAAVSDGAQPSGVELHLPLVLERTC